MNNDVLMALLSLDSYNRGYEARLTGLGVNSASIGDFSILTDSTARLDPTYNTQAANFYAVAYQNSSTGETVISYRGTDNLSEDAFNSYAIGMGDPLKPQGTLAVRFYKSVVGQDGSGNLIDNPLTANITLVGHSLGGGLAGYIASLYNKRAVIFDNMTFEAASAVTHAAALTNQWMGFAGAKDFLYGPTIDVPVIDRSGITASATTGELLTPLRAAGFQATLVDNIDSNGGTRNPIDLHSMALLTLLKWNEAYGSQIWAPAGEELWDAFFNSKVAEAISATSERDAKPRGLADRSAVLANAIAYSVLDSGTRPFGDTAVFALFNDASDLGYALSPSDASASLKAAAPLIAQMLIEFAGKLALGAVEGGASSPYSGGMLSGDGGDILTADLSASAWSVGASHTKIVGREELIGRVFSQMEAEGYISGTASGPTNSVTEAVRSDLVTGLKWLYTGKSGYSDSDPTAIVDRVVFKTTEGGFSGSVPERQHPNSATDGVTLFVSATGNDTIEGDESDDFIYGAGGNDTIHGGGGDDLIAGGDGNDVLSGGAGHNFIAGGDGDDALDLGISGAGVGANISLRAIVPTSSDERASIEVVNGAAVNRIVDIERIELTNFSDKVSLLGDLDEYHGDPLKVSMGGSAVAFHQDEVDASQSSTGVYFNLGSGNAVGLDKTTNHGASVGLLGWALPYVGAILEPTDIQITGANSAIGSNYSDILIGSSGKQGSGEGYSALYGAAGNDMLIGAGWESHLYGGAGDDQFGVGANTIIEDAQAHDGVFYAGVPIFGGAKQWWMEAGTAYWSPISTIMGAFPVIGASVLATASFFIDVPTMKFANFQRSQTGDLILRLGWGWGGTATIKNYNLDLDSGVATGGVAVFQQDFTTLFKDYSLGQLTKYVNLALKAGFGFGLHGYDPLVLDLDGDGYELTTEVNSQVWFDYSHNGFAQHTGWVRGDDGLLVRDLNANGKIDDASELFGNATQGGFDMLATLDGNLDGVINASDAVYATLKVWQDFNQDGITDAGELKTLADLGIVSISLATTVPAEPTAVGSNQIAREGTFTLAGGVVHKLADVVFDVNAVNTRYLGDTSVSAAASVLPQLAGFGSVSNLRVAMTQDSALLGLVNNFASNATNDLSVLKAGAEAILYAWAGVDSVSATALGSNGFDTRKLAFLEKYTSAVLMPRDAGGAPLLTNLAEMEQLWADQVTRLTLRLAVQGPLSSTFADVSYRTDLDLLIADGPTALGDILDRVIAGVPAGDHTAALAQWAAWAPLLAALIQSMVRADGNVVRSDFLFTQLVRAADEAASPLTLQELAAGLGIANLHYGTGVAESLNHTAGETNVFFGNGGDDTLNGGTGQDVYVFGHNIGHSVINDVEAREGGDRIRFAFLNASDVTVARSGDDLLITVAQTGETIRVVGQFAPVAPLSSDVLLSPNRGIEDIQFADGTIWETPEIMGAVGTGTSGNDHMVGTMHSDVFIGKAGDDLLEGGDDADLYVINAGDGNDTISDIQTTPLLRAADMVIFGDGIAPEDLVMTRVGATGDDLLFTMGGGGQTLLIKNQFAYSILGFNASLAPNNRIEAFGFREYGDAWGLRDIEAKLIAQSSTSGNDTILGFGDDDLIDGGAGHDTLVGLDGQDTYRWGSSDGNDVIDERALYVDIAVGLGGLSLTARADTVEFKDFNAADLVFTRPGAAKDLLITNTATGQTLMVHNQFNGFQTGVLGAQWFDRIEWFKFADGSRISWQDVEALVTTGDDAANNLYGDVLADSMRGGKGDDHLHGDAGGDTYYFNVGDGHDTIVDNDTSFLGDGFLTVNGSPDILKLGAGISAADISFLRYGKNVDLIVGTNGDRITLTGQDDYIYTGVFGTLSSYRIEEIHFDNGEVWTWHDLNQRVIAAATTSGNDTTLGTSTDDVFAASAGDDILDGGDGNDTYAFGAGSGHDIIRDGVENVFAGDADKLVFAAGITLADLSFARVGDGLKITLTATGDSVTIEGQYVYSAWFTWNDIETFEFADGTTLSKEEVSAILLAGTAGNDTLVGFDSDDVLDGGLGNDDLSGGNGSDLYIFDRGYGHDVIHEGVSNTNVGENDTVRFGPGIAPGDVILSRSGNDIIISLTGSDDTLTIVGQFNQAAWFSWDDIETFEFHDGTVWSKDVVAAKLLAATAGDDTLVGTIGNDRLDGLAGNDTLNGGDGADTYVFGRGYGHDTVHEDVTHVFLSDDDRLVFNSGITLADLTFTHSGDDLIISINGTDDTITIYGEFNSLGGYTWYDIEHFEFADGTILDKDAVKQIVLSGTPGNDHIIGFDGDDTITGGAGDDILEGHDGDDTYRFGVGDGHDVILERLDDGRNRENDKLAFKAGVAPADVTVTREGQDAVFTLASGDSIRVQGQFNEGYNEFLSSQDVESVTFADGTVWDKVEIDRRTIHPTTGDDVMLGTWYSQTYEGLAGNDTVYAGGGDDILNGGAGNDRLEGGAGNDRYIYNIGDGEDVVWDDEFWGNGFNRISFGAGITAADLRIVGNPADGSDMIVQFANAAGSIRILNQWTSDPRIDGFTFADGTTWDINQIATAFASAQATPGNDTVVGTFGADFLTGGAGNDTLNGLGGDDTYVFNLGDGQDYIFDRGRDVWYGVEPGGYDKIQFGVGITAADIDVIQVSWNDIALKVRGTSDRIVIGGMLGTGFAAIEEVRFADGTVWGFADTIAKSQLPTSGDDVIYSGYTPSMLNGAGGNDTLNGSGSNDTLKGGVGNDTLYGNAGDDTYVFTLGDGQDYIYDRGPDVWYGVAPGGYDNIQFGVGISAADIDVVQISWNDIALRVRGTSDQIVIGGMIGYSFAAIEEVRFADGTVWSFAAIIARSQASTSGDDTIYSGYTPSTISGGAGNDTLIGSDDTDTLLGGEGNDTLYGNNGTDVLAGGAGTDRLEGGGGNDVYRFGLGDGQDTIFDRGPDRWYGVEDGGFDRIEFGPGIVAADIEIVLSGNDMTFRIRGTADQITVAGMFNPSYSALEEVRFDDGTIWSRADIIALTVDEIPDPAWISGGSGNDELWGTGGADTFLGGKGDDMLRGGGGADTYRYRSGHGNDTIWDDGPGSDQDVLNLTNLNAADVELSRAGTDLWIRDIATGQQIKVWAQFHPNVLGVEQLVFADGTTWDREQIRAAAWFRGGAGNDQIYGSDLSETLVGGKGDDRVEGYSGNDTYRYASGDGNDFIVDGGPGADTDTLKLTDLNSADVELRRDGWDLIIRDLATGQETRVWEQFHPNIHGVEQLVFANGTTWDRAQIQAAAWIRGGAGNDQVYGSDLSDTLVGGKGDDRVEAYSGNDTYRYASGDGNDFIVDGGPGGDTDVLKLTDLNAAQVELRRDGWDLLVRDITTGQETRVWEQFHPNNHGVEQLVCADGTTWDRNQIQLLADRSGSDSIIGTSSNDALYGMAGNDTITGLGGNDSLVGGTGNDYLDGDGFVPIGSNLIVNGSFEQLGPNPSFQSWGVWSDSLPGWTKTNSGRFNQVTSGVDGSPATDGQYLMDLDDSGGAGSNMDIRQTIGNLVAGQKLVLNFDHGNPRNSSSGYFEVYWNGQLVATVTDLGAQMRATQLTLTAIAGDNVIRFQGLGAEDAVGAQIDNVRLFAAEAVTGNDLLNGGRGDDTLIGGAGSDTYRYASGDGNDLILDVGALQDIDTLMLTDLDASDVTVRREGKDAWIRDLTTGQEIHIQDQFRAAGAYGVEQVIFADGTIWDRAALSLQAPGLAPEVASDAIIEGALVERVGLSGAAILDTVSGALRFSDSAAGAAHSVVVDAVSADGAVSGLPANSALLSYFSVGAISEPGSGNEGEVIWTFAAQDSVFDYLQAGQSLQLTYSLTLANDAGRSVEQDIVVSVTGTNDVPSLSAGSVVQGGVLELAATGGSSTSDVAAGTLRFSDADTGDTHSASIVSVTATGITAGLPANATLLTWLTRGVLGEQAGATPGSLPWSFDAPDSSFDFLGAGQAATLTYVVQIADGDGGTLNQNVVITITGTNDGPVIAAGTTLTGTITELASLTNSNTVDSAAGTIEFTDLDRSDSHTASVASVAASGVTSGLPATGVLLSLLSLGTVTEQAGATPGSFGWTFSAVDKAFDYLAAGETVTLSYSVQASDGQGGVLTQPVVVTVTGTNDAPLVAAGGTTSASVSELTTTTASSTSDTASGSLKFSDGDASDVHAASVMSVVATGTTSGLPSNATLLAWLGTGTLVEQNGATSGSVGWSFGAPDSSFDYLRAGQVATLTYAVQIGDGHGGNLTQNVVITVTGTDDIPVIAAGTTSTAALTELASVTGSTTNDTGSGTIKFADADVGDTHSVGVVSVVASGITGGLPANSALLAMLSLGTVTQQAGATPGSVGWTFSAQDKTFDYLGAGQVATLTYTVAVNDNQGGTVNQNVVVTVIGSNDGPVLAAGSTLAGTITELANTTGSATNDTATGAIKFTDADIADVHGLTISSVTASGTTTGLPGNTVLLAMLTAGAVTEPVGTTAGSAAWTFAAQDQTFDYLKPGQSATLTYAVQLADGKGGTFSQNVVITVNGSNDAPVVTVPGAQTARTSTATRIAGISVADADAGATETVTVTTSVGTIASTATGGATVSGSASKTMTISGTLAAVNSTLATLTYTAGASAGSDTIQIVSNDGTTTNTKTIAETVSTTANHGPVINAATVATGAFTELTVVSNSTTADTATGSIKFDDADVPDTHTVTVTSVAASGITSGLPANATLLTYLTKGTVTEPSGTTPGSVTWTFSAQDKTFDYLGVGQTTTLTYVVTVADNKGGSTTQNVVITATGTNDAAFVSAGTTTGAITERASLTGSSLADTASGLVKFADEAGDTHTATIVSVAASGTTTGLPANAAMLAWLSKGALTEQVGATPGSVPWSFSAPDSAFDYLRSGQTATLTYVVRVTDNLGANLDQSVVVTVTGANDAPTAQAKSGFTTDNWTALTITGATLLAGATDPDTGSTFTLSSVQGAAGGTVALTSGNAVFTPSGTAIGPASFTYTISDGSGGTSTATVSITTTLHQINGTSTANTLAGNSTKKSQIDGLGGNDTITAGGVGDVIIGGAGTDTLTGGAGSDTFVYHAGFGLDTINSFTATGTSKDVLQIDTSLFADWAHLLGATAQVGTDLVITLDAADKITLKNVAMANFTSANAVFV